MLQHHAGNRLLEQIGIIIQIAAQILFVFFHGEGHIELGRAIIDPQRAEIYIERGQISLLRLL